MADNQKFDYVIVGSGPAGCVLFNRLSENPDVTVLLLEAGHDEREYPMEEKVGLEALFSMWGPATDWGYATEVEAGICHRSMPIIQGKVLGGGSSVNGRIHMRGNRRDYDYWNYLGNDGWSYKDLLPYFKKCEDYQGPDNDWNGKGGPVTIVDLAAPSPASQAFIASAVETLGLAGPLPLNGPRQENACGYSQSATTKDMKRVDMARAYVHPAEKRPNTKVLTQAFATRVLTDGTRAVGVDTCRTATCRPCARSARSSSRRAPFNSPKLLMLSGIGPAAQLKANGIPVLVDLPGVGENLQDHLLVRMGWSATKKQPVPNIISEANLFTHTRKNVDMASPDLQCLFGPFVFPTPMYSGPGFTMVPSIEQASSVGTVTLRSKNPVAPPVLRPNYLSTEGDMQILLNGHAHRPRDRGRQPLQGARRPRTLPRAGLQHGAGDAQVHPRDVHHRVAPRLHLQDGARRDVRRRSAVARLRHAGPPGVRRVDHAAHGQRQSAGHRHHDRREGRRRGEGAPGVVASLTRPCGATPESRRWPSR